MCYYLNVHLGGQSVKAASDDICFRASNIVRWSWEIFSFAVPQSELAHVVKSGLPAGHTISDPRPIHRPLIVS